MSLLTLASILKYYSILKGIGPWDSPILGVYHVKLQLNPGYEIKIEPSFCPGLRKIQIVGLYYNMTYGREKVSVIDPLMLVYSKPSPAMMVKDFED